MSQPASFLDRFAFPFTEENLASWDLAHRFGRERLAPGAAERDRTGEYPEEAMRELSRMGLLTMRVSPDDGGAGLDMVSYALALEAISESCASTALCMAATNLAASILAKYGTPAQRDRWLRPVTSGEAGPFSFSLTEPQSGSDAGALTTRAVRDGDDYVLDGSKIWVTNGSHAGRLLIFARTTPSKGAIGITAFVVSRDTPGLTVGPHERTMGQRASGSSPVYLEGCRVPAEDVVGKPGSGYFLALRGLSMARIGMAGLCLGIGEAAYREGLAYSKERKVFGQRVIDFQNTQFQIADMRTELDAAWLLMLRAAVLVDRGKDAWSESSMAKLYASETVGRVVDRVLQLHGGNGYSQDHLIERLYRDARVTRIYEGTSEVQRLIIGADLAKS